MSELTNNQPDAAPADVIAANVAAVRGRIASACERAGRDAAEVRLLPVSKTHPVEALVAAHAAGIDRFGENRVQELVAKAELLDPALGIEFALIGPLQSNKAGRAVEWVAEFQALDSLKLAANLDRRLQALGRSLDVLVEVNTSGESTKFGLAPDDVLSFAAELGAFDSLNVRGLMTIAIPSPDQKQVAACFQMLRGLRDRLRDDRVAGSDWPELSMGMSGDFELAIEHGATCVRVGTAIFGGRPPVAG